MDELIGRRVGPYTIAEKVGEGGMAVVYKGYQESLNRYVAIKVLRGELARDQEFVTRFRREALAVAKLSHPNILHVYDAGVVEGVYYIVMDYVEGGSLKDLIQRGPIDPQQAIALTVQLAEALDYAHRHNLIHRDVKPSNILLTSDGRPLLTDFGIAKVLHGDTHLTRTGTAIGTPEYMAPEQLQGQAVDARADIYALGVVLFELLAGWSPFSAPTPMATMYKQMNEPPPPLRQVNITIPEWLEAVVGKALAKRPEERFQRASELAEALRRGGMPIVSQKRPRRGTPAPMPRAARSTVVEQPAGKRRKGGAAPILIGVIVVLLLALVAGGGYLFLGRGGPGPTAQSPTVIVVVATAEPSATPAPTDTPLPTEPPAAEPTLAPSVEPETATPLVVVVTATPLPATPTSPPTAAPTLAPTSPPAATKKPAPTKAPAPSGEPGVISDFENFGAWKRGNEANGTFTQSSAQAHQGSYSGKLDYDFPTKNNDYVVFQQIHSIAGQPTRISAWVYGDGSGHFLNVWIKDNGGQVWQVPLGTLDRSGWQQMAGAIDVTQEWPWTHISGTDNGKVDYPITFQALVLDDKPDTFTGSGTIYIDDLRADTGSASPSPGATKPAAAQPTSPPASGGISGVSGKIVYSAGGAMHIVDAQTGKDLVAPFPGMFQPDLRADGQLIIANGEGHPYTSIATIDAKTGAFIRNQSAHPDQFRPSWAPDGGQFVYDSYHHGGKFASAGSALGPRWCCYPW